jgi:hypothetical protein
MTIPLMAITAYYNPFRGALRRQNYRCFRRLLGIPLLTVEWSQDGQFDLNDDDADLMVRVEGGDLLWQKERLLNLGIEKARKMQGVSCVALLDCDVVFTQPDWHARVVEALEGAFVVQCYDQVAHLPPLQLETMGRKDLAATPAQSSIASLAASLAQGHGIFNPKAGVSGEWPRGQVPLAGNPGMATALRLDRWPHLRLYEGNIVGGGDLVLLAALNQGLDEMFTHRAYSAAHQADIRRWARHEIPPRARLGHAANRLLHLWHGALEDRRYAQRQAVLAGHCYDPAIDLDPGREGPLGLIEGSHALRQGVKDYLSSRKDA